jgi:hypothetical protein
MSASTDICNFCGLNPILCQCSKESGAYGQCPTEAMIMADRLGTWGITDPIALVQYGIKMGWLRRPLPPSGQWHHPNQRI